MYLRIIIDIGAHNVFLILNINDIWTRDINKHFKHEWDNAKQSIHIPGARLNPEI